MPAAARQASLEQMFSTLIDNAETSTPVRLGRIRIPALLKQLDKLRNDYKATTETTGASFDAVRQKLEAALGEGEQELTTTEYRDTIAPPRLSFTA